jgi:acetoacetate decarboxylase
MKPEDVRNTAFAMPLCSPSYPIGPYRFSCVHLIADLTLDLGEVVHDYLA